MNLKGCIQYYTNYIKRVKWISLLESLGSLIVTSFSGFIMVVAESSRKDFCDINGKFVGNIPGWDDFFEVKSGVWV